MSKPTRTEVSILNMLAAVSDELKALRNELKKSIEENKKLHDNLMKRLNSQTQGPVQETREPTFTRSSSVLRDPYDY